MSKDKPRYLIYKTTNILLLLFYILVNSLSIKYIRTVFLPI